MKTFNVQFWAWAVSIAAAITIIALVIFGLSAIERFSQVNEHWKVHSEKVTANNQALARLRGGIGYGGFIHNFKNYVLRRDAIYWVRVKDDIENIKALLKQYRKVLSSKSERDALQSIKVVLASYFDKFPLATKMIAEGHSSVDIDKAVKIDDKPALEAFDKLIDIAAEQSRLMKAQTDAGLRSAIRFLSIGALLIVLVIGVAVLVIGFIRKITYVNSKLQTANNRINLLFDTAPDPMMSVRPDGSVAKYNTQAEMFFGYTQSEVAGMIIEDFMPESFREIHTHARSKYLQSPKFRKMNSEVELVALTKDGQQLFTDISLSHSDFEDDPLTILTLRDITERKHAEEELARYRENLEELVEQRTNEVEEKATQLEAALEREKEYSALQKKVVALVGHEFRTPLTIIDSTAQRLIRRKGKLDADEIETRVDKVRAAVARMISLIDTTLYVSQMDEGKIKIQCTSSDIGELLLEVCERQAEVSLDHQFNIEVKELPGEMWFDRKLLDHVFGNLLSNAVKYSPMAPQIDIKGWQENNEAVIAFTDHGIGIPEGDMPHMFGRFFRATTASEIKGTGLGLSMCKEFLEMHGGTIGVDSAEGKGSTFTIRVPIADKDQ